MRIGIFGGSFDPVHYGHLLLAECCREACALDEVWFIPAAISPHKRERSMTRDEFRLEMLRLAIGGHEAFRVQTLELERGGVSFTVDTLESIAAIAPESERVLLLGSDAVADLPTWHRPQRILELASIACVQRPDSPAIDVDGLLSLLPPDRRAAFSCGRVEMPLIEISSSAIRRRVAAGRSIRYWLPRSVEKYIESKQLYRGSEANP